MKKILAALLFAAVLCGCHSDQYYHNDAVERAREFLLKNCDDLSSEQIYFVRFNAPVLLHAPVLKSSGANANRLPVEKHQICVTWMIPGKDKLYMVFGVSSGRMSDWSPNRMVYKSVIKSRTVLPDAAAKSVKYAKNNLRGELSAREFNFVRYSMPWLLSTDFELNFNTDGKLDASGISDAKKKTEGKKQYSVVWKFGGRNLVCSGLASAGFNGWDIMMAGIVDDATLSRHTKMELMTPEDYYKPFPAEKESVPSAK